MNVLTKSTANKILSSFNYWNNINYIEQYMNIKTIFETSKGGDPIGV